MGDQILELRFLEIKSCYNVVMSHVYVEVKERCPNDQDAGLEIYEFLVQNYQVAPWLNQPFIFPIQSKYVPGTPEDLVFKNKLSPSGSIALKQVNLIHEKVL